eukprot:GHRR01017345.1.p1 GENE.GHRR01017345.1~~GHRR01017345.1.p1  ORF type:complete len:162 (+),score=44.05 GHRR01017345.1:129-614(+)
MAAQMVNQRSMSAVGGTRPKACPYNARIKARPARLPVLRGRQMLRLHASQQTDSKSDTGKSDSSVRQLLGMKGAADENDKWKIRVQLTKPVTWVPLIWGVVCGAAASGNYVWNDPQDIAQLLTCCMMSGPFLTGYTQTINDYYDREIDAINEPYRPIPSGT